MTSQPTPPKPLQTLALLPIKLFFTVLLWVSSGLGMYSVLLRFMRQGQREALSGKAFRGYQATARDVFACTFAKSGTNWALQIAYQIAHRGAGEYDHIHHVVPWPDMPPFPDIARLDDPRAQPQGPAGLRVIKTHLAAHHLPYHPDAKYIVVVRDPKEVAVSSYFFVQKMFSLRRMPPVAEWVAMFMSPNFQFGSWAEHLASYWAWRDRPNVIILLFDELKADLPGAVRRVAALLGVALTEAQLAEVVRRSDFAYMRAIDHKFTLRPPSFYRHPPGVVMMRQGQPGRSSELLTPGQQAQIDAFCQAELRRLGCDFPYTTHFKTVAASVS